MKNRFLLPNGFKRIGWVVLSIAVAIGIYALAIDFEFTSIKQLAWLGSACEPLFNNTIVIGVWLGAIGICCSREHFEDEMVERIRLNALLSTLYIYATMIIVATLFINGIDYLNIMIYNLVAQPLIYVVIYHIMLYRWQKSIKDEE